jgi:hypothetical protein
MNEIIFYELDRENICETMYFDGIARVLNEYLIGYSIIFTADWITLPETKYKKVVILGGEEAGLAGLTPYSDYPDVVAVFRFYSIKGRYDNEYVFPIPCGYNCRSNDKQMVKMYTDIKVSKRKYDIFYSGQILNCRKELISRLTHLSKDFNVYLQTTPSFRTGLDIDDYYKMLGDTKICVCPDGISVDTFRFMEACGSGCIVITTNKSSLWYYQEAPVFFVDSWIELTADYIKSILSSDVDEIQEQTLVYYKNKLSEEAVAKYIINTVCSIN